MTSVARIIQNEHLVMKAKEVEATVPVYLRREVELEPDFAGKPSGFDMSRVSIDPASLEIAATDDVFRVLTPLEQLDFSRINTRYRSFDNLETLIPTGCKNLSNATKASLSIDMSGMTYQTFTVTQFEVLNLSSDKEASVSTQSLNVEINGPAGEIANLTEEDIVAVIDMRGRGILYRSHRGAGDHPHQKRARMLGLLRRGTHRQHQRQPQGRNGIERRCMILF